MGVRLDELRGEKSDVTDGGAEWLNSYPPTQYFMYVR